MSRPRPPLLAAAAKSGGVRSWRDPRLLGPLLAAILVGIAVVAARPWFGRDAAFGPVAQVAPAGEAAELTTAPEIGNLAPNFRLRTIDGGEVRLSDLRGRPVFLNFWATWCVFCVTEMPAMQKLADRHGGAVAVVGVNVGEEAGRARGFAVAAGIRYPLLLDSDRAVTKAYEVRAMPTSLFLDADGVVRVVKYGGLTPPEMEAFLEPLLSPSP